MLPRRAKSRPGSKSPSSSSPRPSPWSAPSFASSSGLTWTPIAAHAVLAPPAPGTEDGTRIIACMDEAMEHAQLMAEEQRFPPVPTEAPSGVVDRVGLDHAGEGIVLVTQVQDDPAAATYAVLRVLHQARVWSWAHERNPDGLVDALNGVAKSKLGANVAFPRATQRSALTLRAIVAFDAPPELAVLRRTFALLDELADFDPSGIVRSTELWAWPDGARPFRIPSRVREAGRTRRCGRCRSPFVVPIVFGYPGADLRAAAARGEVELGGCVLEDDDGGPSWECRACGRRW